MFHFDFRVFYDQKPAVDLDGDGFSTHEVKEIQCWQN